MIVILSRGVTRLRRATHAAHLQTGLKAKVSAMSDVLRPAQKSVQAVGSRAAIIRLWFFEALRKFAAGMRHIKPTLARLPNAARRLVQLGRRYLPKGKVREPNLETLFSPTEMAIKTRVVEVAPASPPAQPAAVLSRPHGPKKKPKLSPLQRAQAALHDKDWQHAEDILVDYIVHHTKDTKAYMLLGRIATAKANWPEAMEIYEQVVSLRPSEPGAQAGLGTAAYNCGRYAKALAALQRAHEADPTNMAVLKNLLDIAHKMDNPALQHSIDVKLQDLSNPVPVP